MGRAVRIPEKETDYPEARMSGRLCQPVVFMCDSRARRSVAGCGAEVPPGAGGAAGGVFYEDVRDLDVDNVRTTPVSGGG